MSIGNPHDRFFKQVFSKKENAVDLIRAILPAEIRSKLVLDSLNLENTSYVDEQLKEHFSDLVYSCRIEDQHEIKISILLEHKSYAVEYPHLQILRYLLMIWETQAKQKQPLTIVIPIVIYHGKDRWHYRELSEYFIEIDAVFERFLPSFEYIFRDLSTYSDQEIKERIFEQVAVGIAIGLMKSISHPEQLERAVQEFLAVGRFYFEHAEGLRFLESVVRYLFYSSELQKETVIETIRKISDKGVKTAMTIAEQLKAEGLREGILEGIELAIELKWGAAGLHLYEKKIKLITSLEKLQEIKEAIRIARDINELEKKL